MKIINKSYFESDLIFDYLALILISILALTKVKIIKSKKASLLQKIKRKKDNQHFI